MNLDALKELHRRAKLISDPQYVILSPEFVHREVGLLATLVADLIDALIVTQEQKHD